MNETGLDRLEIEQLLPWHAAGTLSRHDAAEINAALARDPELMRRYMLAREEKLATVELNESLGEPSPRTMHRLFVAIDAQSGGGALKLAEYIRQLLSGLTARQFALSVSTIAALILAGGVLAGIFVGERQNNQVAQTAAPEKAAPAGYAVVRFTNMANIESISALLTANRATIIEGPSSDGLYRLRIAALANPETVYRGIENTSSAEQQRDRAVANLRAATAIVQFVTPQP